MLYLSGAGITQLPWRHPWLLLLDADNVVTPELRREISEVLGRDAGTVNAYYNPHTHYFRNRRVFSLKGDWLRLIRRNHVTVDQSELVGEILIERAEGDAPQR